MSEAAKRKRLQASWLQNGMTEADCEHGFSVKAASTAVVRRTS